MGVDCASLGKRCHPHFCSCQFRSDQQPPPPPTLLIPRCLLPHLTPELCGAASGVFIQLPEPLSPDRWACVCSSQLRAGSWFSFFLGNGTVICPQQQSLLLLENLSLFVSPRPQYKKQFLCIKLPPKKTSMSKLTRRPTCLRKCKETSCCWSFCCGNGYGAI